MASKSGYFAPASLGYDHDSRGPWNPAAAKNGGRLAAGCCFHVCSREMTVAAQSASASLNMRGPGPGGWGWGVAETSNSHVMLVGRMPCGGAGFAGATAHSHFSAITG
jgi:hypothetical protein